MDANSIEQIIALSQQSMIQQESHVPAMVVSNKCSIETTEHLLKNPAFYRAALSTRFISQFADYVNANESDKAQIFINDRTLSAEAIFDMGDCNEPEWGHHRASIKLDMEPEYNALLDSDGKKKNQSDFIDFIEDWADSVEFYCDGESIDTKDGVNRIRRIKTNSNSEQSSVQGDFNQSRSAMESIEVTSDGNKLPDGFLFTCKPFHDLPVKSIYCKLKAHTGEKLQLSFRISGASKLAKELTDDFCSILLHELTMDNVTIGTMRYQNG